MATTLNEKNGRAEQALYTSGFTLLLAGVVIWFFNSSLLHSVLLDVVIGVCGIGGVVLVVLASRRGSVAEKFRQMGVRSKVSAVTALFATVLLIVTIPLGMRTIYYITASVSVLALAMLSASVRHDAKERRRLR